jgi:DNA-binding MarR family transcriptional regulator
MVTSHDQYTHHILTEIEADNRVSQRSLSRDMGIALGLTNLLVRHVVRKGWVRIIRIKPNRVRYLLTPAGIAEKARMSRAALQGSTRFYVEARDRIRERFATLSRELPGDGHGSGDNLAAKPIVFYGSGEVAEVGYVCLQGTDLQLVGVVDDQGRERFFDVPVYDPALLHATDINGSPFGRLVVMSFAETENIRAQLKALAIPPDRIFWI